MTTVIPIVEGRPNQPIGIRHGLDLLGSGFDRYATRLIALSRSSTCAGTLRLAQNFVLSHFVHFASLLPAGHCERHRPRHGLPSLHTLLIYPRRLLQVAAGVCYLWFWKERARQLVRRFLA